MQTTKQSANGITSSAIPVSPSAPTSAPEMLPVLRELIARKAANGESFQFVRNGRNALDLLRREIKRRMNLDLGSKLPDDINQQCEIAVSMFAKSLVESVLDDGYQLASVRKGVSFVKFDEDNKQAEIGFRNTVVAKREHRNDGELLKIQQDARRNLEKRIDMMRKNPSKYTPEQIRVCEQRHAVCENVIATIRANNKAHAESK
jgi:hypothetical protein